MSSFHGTLRCQRLWQKRPQPISQTSVTIYLGKRAGWTFCHCYSSLPLSPCLFQQENMGLYKQTQCAQQGLMAVCVCALIKHLVLKTTTLTTLGGLNFCVIMFYLWMSVCRREGNMDIPWTTSTMPTLHYVICAIFIGQELYVLWINKYTTETNCKKVPFLKHEKLHKMFEKHFWTRYTFFNWTRQHCLKETRHYSLRTILWRILHRGIRRYC